MHHANKELPPTVNHMWATRPS